MRRQMDLKRVMMNSRIGRNIDKMPQWNGYTWQNAMSIQGRDTQGVIGSDMLVGGNENALVVTVFRDG